MRHFTALAVSSAVSLSGCASTGQLTPQAQSTVTAAYNQVCGSNGQPGAVAVVQAWAAVNTLNATQSEFLADIQQMCAAGSPTNVYSATIDALITVSALQKVYPYAKITTK